MGSQASNTSYPIACVVIGGGGVVGGGIPKSPSFHSSLELAEATGRQIVSPDNCNYFTFTNTTMNDSGAEPTTANHVEKQQQQSSLTNGFVAKTIQNFARFQNMTNNQLPQRNTFVDNENNDTLSSSSSLRTNVGQGQGQGVSNSITNRINSINNDNGPNWGSPTSNNLVKMQQTNNISTTTCGDKLKPSGVAHTNGSPSRTRDRNNLNGGVSPSFAGNGTSPLPLIKGSYLYKSWLLCAPF